MENCIRPTELLDNIAFLNDEDTELYIEYRDIWNNCKYLSPLDLYLILELLKPNKYSIELILELLRPVWIEPEKKCWFRSKDWSHYSNINKIGTHRVSFEIFRGPLISGREVCHHCDRPGCINPWHLFQGTHKDNMEDAMKKNRKYHKNLKCKNWLIDSWLGIE